MTDLHPGSTSSTDVLTLEFADSGIATLELRALRGTSLPLSLAVLREVDGKLSVLEDTAAQGQLSLLVIRTAAPHPVLSGYDLEELRAASAGGIVEWSLEAKTILRRLEQLPFPSVALVQGDWLGAAAELALACSYRVASAATEARLGFPQTRRGLLPVWGGTVRLPRLVGLSRALRLILSGDPVEAREAADIGLVDQLIPVDDFDERLQKFLKKLAAESSRGSRRKRRLARRLFEDTAPGRRALSARAARRHLTEASATLAARVALELMVETCAIPLGQAFDRESAAAGELIVTDETQGRLHSERMTELATSSPAEPHGGMGAAAVIGGGETGSEFARLLIASGSPVRIKDSREVARNAVARTRARIEWEVREGRLTEEEGASASTLVESVSGFGGFGLLDVAIVAPDGTSGDVAELTREVEAHIRSDCLLAIHDWALPPGMVQSSVAHPERVIGLVPALPAGRFPLLEIVAGERTSEGSVERAVRLGRQSGRTAIVVREPMPTPATRLLCVYLAEATRILQNGVPADRIDSAIEAFGFSLGPFRRIDAIGSRRVERMFEAVARDMGARALPADSFRSIAREGASFYRYRNGRSAGLNPKLPEPAPAPGEHPADIALGIRRRILLLLINEAFRIMEEGAVDDPEDLEAIAILGLGFPREHGGLLYYAESIGLAGILNDLRRDEDELGSYFAPAELLIQLAGESSGFFPARNSASGHTSTPMLE